MFLALATGGSTRRWMPDGRRRQAPRGPAIAQRLPPVASAFERVQNMAALARAVVDPGCV